VIPEITQSQAQAMRDMVNQLGAFSQIVPEEEKDGTNYPTFMAKTLETQELVDLGLVREITADHNAKMAETYVQTGRHFRVYEITDIGSMLFSDIESRSIN
jgi:hypothetical protein